MSNKHDDYWQLWWLWNTYWEFGYFFIFLLITVLWWPNGTSYSSIEQETELDIIVSSNDENSDNSEEDSGEKLTSLKKDKTVKN